MLIWKYFYDGGLKSFLENFSIHVISVLASVRCLFSQVKISLALGLTGGFYCILNIICIFEYVMNLWILFKSSILAGLHWQCTGRRGASPGYCQVGGVVQKPCLPTRPLLTGMCACTLSHLVMSNSLQLHDCSLLGSFVHGILQARIFSMPSSRSPQPGDWTWVSHIASRFFTIWTTREALYWQEGLLLLLLLFSWGGWVLSF